MGHVITPSIHLQEWPTQRNYLLDIFNVLTFYIFMLLRYQRLLAPNYADEIHSMPVSRSRNPLPSARLLSYKVFGRDTIPDPHFTLLNMQWGQLIAHDTSLHLENGVPGLKPLEGKLYLD